MRHPLLPTLWRHAAIAAALAVLPSTARAHADGDGFAASLNLAAVMATTLARHPALVAREHRARALAQAGQAEAGMPAPELGLEAWNLPLTRPWSMGEAGMYMVELRQRFPPAGRREAQALALREESEAALDDLAGERMALAQRAVNAFMDFAEAHAGQQLQAQQLQLLERVGQALGARYTTGAAPLAELSRVEVEISQLRRAGARAQAQLASAAARLNVLLRRPADAPLGPPHMPPPETVALAADALVAQASLTRGESLAAAARARASAARVAAADADARLPEFVVGVGYWQDPTMRPGLGLTGAMTLPWLSGQARSRQQQAHEEAMSDGAMAQAGTLETEGEVAGLLAQLRGETAELQLIQGQSLPASRRALEAVGAARASGQATLSDWLASARAVLELELERVATRAALARSLAALDRAVGQPVPRVPLTEAP